MVGRVLTLRQPNIAVPGVYPTSSLSVAGPVNMMDVTPIIRLPLRTK